MNTIFKTKTTISLYFLIVIFLLSCRKGTDIAPNQPKCRLSKISGILSVANIEFKYSSQNQLVSYSSPQEQTFATFKYNSKGNVSDVIWYSDTIQNLQKSYIVYKLSYDSNNNLTEFSTDWKNNPNANGIEYTSVIMNEKKQVISLKYATYIENFVYDSRGNVIKTYSSSIKNPQAIPKIYIEYGYDNMRNKFQNLPWFFQFRFTDDKGFGENNFISEKFVDGTTFTENNLSKIAYNENGYPSGLLWVDGKSLFVNYEYNCD